MTNETDPTKLNSLVQLSATEEMRGRVMSIFMLAFRGAMPLGNLAAGYVASRFSPTAALLGGSAALALTALIFLASSSGVKRL